MLPTTNAPPPPSTRPTRRRLCDFPSNYWSDIASAQNPLTTLSSVKHQNQNHLSDTPETFDEPPTVSETPVCHTCSQTFTSFVEQRDHFRTDWHKFNVKRRVKDRGPLTETQFEDLSDLGSVESLSGSEEEDDDEVEEGEDISGGESVDVVRFAEKVEFRDPRDATKFMVLYRAALPDGESIASLARRGSWVVIMVGGGHFVAAVWDVAGELRRRKTFHRYTSRKKQGGSQAAADEARGGGSRIRSAGSALRRYGEQALQKEVQELLQEWYQDISEAQCVFVRASHREKRDLLIGWMGSPLKEAVDRGAVRNIPMPTRRATLKEAIRVYEELASVRISSVSLRELGKDEIQPKADKPKSVGQASKSGETQTKKPDVKGTDHLKKREEKEKAPKLPQKHVEEEKPPEVDKELAELLKACVNGDKDGLSTILAEKSKLGEAVFEKHYFAGDSRFENQEAGLGLIGVAAVCGNTELLTWLLDKGVSPTIGASPYVANKSKAVRTALRTYWGQNARKYDYAAAGIPSPLSDREVEELAEKDRAKRRKEREKKKEKAREKAEAAKPPEQKARELRAAAAEARILGKRCAGCGKSVEGMTPFSRLAYKYCSTDCVAKHREVLNRLQR